MTRNTFQFWKTRKYLILDGNKYIPILEDKKFGMEKCIPLLEDKKHPILDVSKVIRNIPLLDDKNLDGNKYIPILEDQVLRGNKFIILFEDKDDYCINI